MKHFILELFSHAESLPGVECSEIYSMSKPVIHTMILQP
jgi:hypothetical protein